MKYVSTNLRKQIISWTENFTVLYLLIVWKKNTHIIIAENYQQPISKRPCVERVVYLYQTRFVHKHANHVRLYPIEKF